MANEFYLYMGEETRYWRLGLSSQTDLSVSMIEANTGSSLPDTELETDESEDVTKLVMHATMQTEVSDRTFLKLSEKIARWPHGMTWDAFSSGLARKEVLPTFRWTLESPMRL